MTIGKRLIVASVSICTLMMLMMPFAACDKTSVKSVDKGATWEVSQTTGLSELNIGEGATIKAPEGKSLTMTVNGVETEIIPGAYQGDIVLTVNDEIIVNYRNTDTYQFRTGVYINDGKYIPEKSVASSVAGGTVTDASASDLRITSVGDNFNGIIVTGDSTYTINNPVIEMTGNGRNDFAGLAASIMTDGNAVVTIENAKINNTGAVRPAIWVGGNSIATINNSDIETHSGTLPSDYSFSWVAGGMDTGKVFMEVPWVLGCVGNTRSTILIGNSKAFYNNSRITAYGWGALSTDQVSSDSILYATNCLIEAFESGYGSFVDGSANTYSGCTFNVADYGLIMQGGSAYLTDGTVMNSERLGIMSYGGSTILNIDKGCVLNSKKAVIQIKGGSPTILVDNAQLNSESGVIFQAMPLDDPVMAGRSGGGGTPGGGAPGGALPEGGAPGMAGGGMPGGGAAGMPGGSAPGGTLPEGGVPGMAGGGMPGGMMADSAGSGPKVTFKNVTLNGDIVTSMTSEGDVDVRFEKATITGAISTSVAEHAKGPNGEELVLQDETDLYYLIGEVIDTYSATDDKYGMKASFDKDSRWVVDETSYLTGLTIAQGAVITAPDGYGVTMTVDGVKRPIAAGDYKGKIVIKVNKKS